MKQLVRDCILLYEVGNTRLHPDEIKTNKTVTDGAYPHRNIKTNSTHTAYKGVVYADDEKFHPEHNGVTHDVDWSSTHSTPDKLSDSDKSKTLKHALALHHNYIENHTKPGDVVTNIPLENKDGSGVDSTHNKREAIYSKKAGFSSKSQNAPAMHKNRQFGIVRQHPEDHPDETKRGKNYLEPIHEPSFDRTHSPITKTIATRKIKNTED